MNRHSVSSSRFQDSTGRSDIAGSAVPGLFAGGRTLLALPDVHHRPEPALHHPEQPSWTACLVSTRNTSQLRVRVKNMEARITSMDTLDVSVWQLEMNYNLGTRTKRQSKLSHRSFFALSIIDGNIVCVDWIEDGGWDGTKKQLLNSRSSHPCCSQTRGGASGPEHPMH